MAQAGDYISNKRVLLNSPGRKLSELYYNEADTRVDQIETQVLHGRFEESLNLGFSSTSNINIQNSGNFVHHCMIHMKLPPVLENQFLPRGWGYSILKEISWTIAGSSQSQLRLDGHTIFQTVMSMCKTSEKKSAILHLGGEEYTSSSNGQDVECIVFLPLPWSSLATGDDAKLGLDTGLLTSLLNVKIAINSASTIYGGTATKPSAFLECVFITREQELSNKANSLRSELMSNGDMMLAYPLIRRESASSKETVSETDVTLSIQNFIEADLQGIMFSAHLEEDLNKSDTFAKNPMFPLQCENIELLYNGQSLYRLRGKAGNLIDMLYDDGSGHIDHSRISRTSTVSGVPSTPDQCHIYNFPLNMLKKNISYTGSYANTPRFSSQAMTIKLKVKNPPGLALGQSGPQRVVIFFTYLYSGVAELSKGLSQITFS
jgi:hypothetical protein